jgi:hypothetical protein
VCHVAPFLRAGVAARLRPAGIETSFGVAVSQDWIVDGKFVCSTAVARDDPSPAYPRPEGRLDPDLPAARATRRRSRRRKATVVAD